MLRLLEVGQLTKFNKIRWYERYAVNKIAMETSAVLNIPTKTMVNVEGLPNNAAANNVSMKVVMFAPMIYGITFSRRTKPRLLKGTRILSERVTDIEINVIEAPSANITNGW